MLFNFFKIVNHLSFMGAGAGAGVGAGEKILGAGAGQKVPLYWFLRDTIP